MLEGAWGTVSVAVEDAFGAVITSDESSSITLAVAFSNPISVPNPILLPSLVRPADTTITLGNGGRTHFCYTCYTYCWWDSGECP